MINLGDLNFKIGSVNPSGIDTTIYRIARKDITAWPTIVDDLDDSTATDPADMAVYDGNFTVATGKHFDRIYSTFGKGEASYETVGEDDCKMFNNHLTISFPKLTPEAQAFAKASANGQFVYIFKHDGKYRVIGSKDYPTATGPNGTTGNTAGSAKGNTIEVIAPDVTPLPIYEGTLPLSDGTLNCATGVFTPTPDPDGED